MVAAVGDRPTRWKYRFTTRAQKAWMVEMLALGHRALCRYSRAFRASSSASAARFCRVFWMRSFISAAAARVKVRIVHAPLHQADHPLREHGGLARAGGGGHDQIPLFLYGALLLYGPVHFVPSASANKSAMVIFRVSRS